MNYDGWTRRLATEEARCTALEHAAEDARRKAAAALREAALAVARAEAFSGQLESARREALATAEAQSRDSAAESASASASSASSDGLSGGPAAQSPPGNRAPTMSEERRCAEALMMACDERLGAQSPAALMVCDTYLARDLWMGFVHDAAARELWVCGHNGSGELGLGDTQKREWPTEVAALHGHRIRAAACGSLHTVAVVDDGELWAAGDNHCGQLGLGDTQNRSSFTRIEALAGRRVTGVACGESYTLAITDTGDLLAWGFNEDGQLGLGDSTNRRSPELVAELSGRPVAAIACGWCHSLAALETGEIFAWGSNYRGQLGLGDDTKREVPTQVTTLDDRKVVAVTGSYFHTAAVVDTGELFAWGDNQCGQLGLGDTTDRNRPHLVEALRGRPVKAVSGGWFHTLALLETGEVFACGKNKYGQLGLGDFSEANVSTPQQVHFFDDKRVKFLRSGSYFSGAVLETNELYMWGYNSNGQLGTGDTQSAPAPALANTPAGKQVQAVTFGCTHTVIFVV